MELYQNEIYLVQIKILHTIYIDDIQILTFELMYLDKFTHSARLIFNFK